jgi:diguanylate cyclase (GGDEF)-like protein
LNSQNNAAHYNKELEKINNKTVRHVAFFALSLHASLIFIFAHLDIPILAIANVFSVTAWGIGIYFLIKQRPTISLYLFFSEVIFHSILVCSILGMQLGFQFYLWTVACLLVVLIDYQYKLKTALLAGFMWVVAFALLYILFGDVTYQLPYSHLVPYVNALNIIIAGGPLVYIVGMVRDTTIIQYIKLADLASKDALTELYNRQFSQLLIMDAFRHCNKTRQTLFLVMADVDFFKRINDTFGHSTGDKVLVDIAKTISMHLSKDDIIARWGGEEFLFALPNCTESQAYEKIERLRQAIEALSLITVKPDQQVTMSFGVCQWLPKNTFEQTITLADNALYKSKHNGRNQTSMTVL